MAADLDLRQKFNRVWFFFPFQLLWLHLRYNHFLLFFWFLLFGFTTGIIAEKYGVTYLFLYPEYLGNVGFWSYGIVGFAFGGFIMAFNIYTYIIHAFRFPFLATLSRPFVKFCANNFIIPVIFIVTYIVYTVEFQRETELVNDFIIFKNMLGFIAGQILFIVLSLLYFFRTNQDIFKLTGKTAEELEAALPKPPAGIRKRRGWYFTRTRRYRTRVDTYLAFPLVIRLARESSHYDKETLQKVFTQNHVNAAIFEILVIISFLLIGSLSEYAVFVIPAAASACLLFTIILMLISILMSWFRSWTITICLGLFLAVNFFSQYTNIFNLESQVYGMDYDGAKAPYNNASLLQLGINRDNFIADSLHAINTLEKWKEKASAWSGREKPWMVIVNSSGGGLRSAAWTMRSLQYADSILGGGLMRHTHIITGSSGGLIGATYFRELYLRNLNNENYDPSSSSYIHDISKDILNPILFSVATNDLFIRYQKVDIEGKKYTKNRALSFEKQLNDNTHSLLNKKLKDYYFEEASAKIPTLILAPAIVNDGRRMLISAQPVSYLSYIQPGKPRGLMPLGENFEFNRFFENQGAEKISLITALRLNSTFPYILPNTSLPSEPMIEAMDAGLRDNFGLKTSVQFLYVFNEWLEKNTSGVILLQLRDKEKYFETKEKKNTLLDQLTNPIGSFYGNFFKEQDYNQDQILQQSNEWFATNLEVVTFELNQKDEKAISMSWHLTELEKRRIMAAVKLSQNQKAMEILLDRLSPENSTAQSHP